MPHHSQKVHGATEPPPLQYIGWNGISNEGRLVGSGVYISSFSWYIQIGNYANRSTRMDSFGLRRKK